MTKITIPCVLLAGGKSSRLGRDKTQISFGNQTLSEWVYKRLSHECETIYISTKEREKFHFDAPFLIESSRIHAPIVGMIHAFEILKVPEIIFLSIDTPFVTRATLEQIAQGKKPITYAQSTDRAHYLISKWKDSMLTALTWAFKSKDYALQRIIESHPHESVLASDSECLNINTMEDYLSALKHIEL